MASEKRLIDANAFLEKMKRTSRYFDVVFDVEEMPTVDAVEVVKRSKEIEKAISVLNVYRNIYYKESSGTVEYAVADAINTILPLFAKCLERRTNETD